MSITITCEPPTDAVPRTLLAAMEAELAEMYGPLSLDRTPSARPEDLAAFVVVWEDERPVAGGAVKRLSEGMAEIKRMFVVREARRRGHGRRLLAALEESAAGLGCWRIRLDTGLENPGAQELYESSGYRAIHNYNDNAYASYWGEKDLPAVIPERFNGPPDSGHGGYSAWLAARYVEGPAEVTLRMPPPLGVPMDVERDEDGGVRLVRDGAVVLEARPDTSEIEAPAFVALEDARAARDRSVWAAETHPFPTCFACGPRRPAGDGLELFPGEIGDHRFAVDWTPEGEVTDAVVWAALDCPTAAPVMNQMGSEDFKPCVLARMSARLVAPVVTGEPHVIVAERVAVDGRKRTATEAIYSADGELRAVSRALWIELR